MDMKLSASELADILTLNEYFDDPPTNFANVPECEALVAAAWYVTESALRHETGKCSSQHTRKDQHEPETAAPFTCQCCRYFKQIESRSKRILRSL
jgi:hypothetical protein